MRKIFTLMLSLLALCLPAAAQTAQPDVTLEFPNVSTANESTALTSATFKSTYKAASAYISEISTVTKVYATKDKGMKLGASSSGGTLKISLNAENQKDIEKITLVGQLYNSSKSASVTINNSSSTGSLGGSESEISFTKFTSNVNGSSLTIASSKYVCIRSISIYFKPDKDPVAQPVITCEDNLVSIECSTEGASIVYSTNGSEPSIAYSKPFPITETCTVKAKAAKEGMADSPLAEQECVYVAPAVKPSKPVVTIDGEVNAEEEFAVDYGTKITVSSENATSMVVAYGSEEVPVEGNTYEFEATANEVYVVTPVNSKMPEGEQEGEPVMFTIKINDPQILSVKNGEEAIENGGSHEARIGDEIWVEAKSYALITVKNKDLDVEVTNGKFKIGNEGPYLVTATNPASEQTSEWRFEVSHIAVTEYEANETLNWEFTGVATWSKDNNGMCDTDINNDENSASGIWHAYKEGVCNAGSYNGANFGSGATSSFKNGTVTLTESNIPENAKITSVSLKGIPVKSAGTVVKWGVSVNGANAEGTLDFPADGSNYSKSSHLTKTISNLNLTGNQIVFTMLESTDQKGFYLSGISVSYQVLAEPSAPEFEKPQTISDGTEIVYTVKHGKLHYKIEDAGAAKSPMMRVSEPTADWTVAWEDAGKKFVYTYASGSNHNIYVKNVVNGKEAMGEAINVKEGVLTGVEEVAAEGAEGARELYNLQGVRVSEAEAVPGVYVERRGGKVAKVVIR